MEQGHRLKTKHQLKGQGQVCNTLCHTHAATDAGCTLERAHAAVHKKTTTQWNAKQAKAEHATVGDEGVYNAQYMPLPHTLPVLLPPAFLLLE